MKQPHPAEANALRADLNRLTMRHEDAGADPVRIAAEISGFLRDYMETHGVPLGVTLIPHKGKIG
jgi:hypothetical protein